ncbi:MAG: hypothetical protein E5X64_18145 [Mesorhizobium sp.]|nr:MAG: hypothetical protein E5X64_18145 [Mesorhizobium sp.]
MRGWPTGNCSVRRGSFSRYRGPDRVSRRAARTTRTTRTVVRPLDEYRSTFPSIDPFTFRSVVMNTLPEPIFDVAQLAHVETPEGHPMELLWDVDYVSIPPGQATKLLNRPQRRPLNGIPVRRIDHLNLMAANTGACRDFMVDVLGFRERERVVGDNGSAIASWLSVTNLSHDIAIVPEPTEMRGRFHHVCFHYISVQHLFDLAELAREAGISIEHGPGRHGIGGATFLYMLEPGGNRIEVMGDPGYMIFDPAWKTVVWEASEIADAVVWSGSPVPDSFWVYGTPVPRPVEGTTIAAVA